MAHFGADSPLVGAVDAVLLRHHGVLEGPGQLVQLLHPLELQVGVVEGIVADLRGGVRVKSGFGRGQICQDLG